MSGNDEINYRIVEELGIISSSPKGWTKELNLISWNNRAPKYDIRDWAPNREKMGKGITLSEEELYNLAEIIPMRGGNHSSGGRMTVGELTEQWMEIVEAAPISIRTHLLQSHASDINQNTLLINVNKREAYDGLSESRNMEQLTSFINNILDKEVKIEISESSWK